MKEILIQTIRDFVKFRAEQTGNTAMWGEPLTGFADAADPAFADLRRIVRTDHQLPCDVLPGAQTVLSYYVPIQPEISKTNIGGKTASAEWAAAYTETNLLFASLNTELIELIRQQGYEAAVPGGAHQFDETLLKSRWSQRHVARIAGLGSFGKNNMLITKTGCCGRFSSLITTLPIQPDTEKPGENCLWKASGGTKCGLCIRRCPSGALTAEGFDRRKCYALCLENENLYPGSDVCGKCVAGMPCGHAHF